MIKRDEIERPESNLDIKGFQPEGDRMNDIVIEYTLLRDRLDLTPRRTKVSWTEFAEIFREAHRAPCTVASCRDHACAHKEGPAWSPAVYSSDLPRQRTAIEAVSLLVVDLDRLTDKQLVAATVPLAPYRRILHASHSDRPGGARGAGSLASRHVRTIVAISRPVARTEWPRFWRAAMARLEQPADPACSDADRIYYLPSRPRDAETYYFEIHDGRALDVDDVLTSAGASPRALDDRALDDDDVPTSADATPALPATTAPAAP